MKALKTRAPATKAVRAAAVAGLVAMGVSSLTPEAHAAGLYFSDRGVRPLGRGGAFVAGADDLGSIWYNPAGLADAGTSILFDASWLHFGSDFSRVSNATDANGTVRTYAFPSVRGTTPVLPIPTIGVSYNVPSARELTFAFGAFAPYTAVASYPVTLGDGTPSPSRYSLVSLDGSTLVVTGLWAAYKPIEQIRIGAGVEALVGTFDSTVVFSACPPQSLVCAQEDPNYDAYSQLKVGPIFAPSGNMGATFVPDPHLRIGISGQLPFHIDAPATVTVKLPNAVEFDHASQQGNQARVKFELPAVFRAGVEGRMRAGPGDLRVELAYVREFWTTQHSIDIVPTNITLLNVRSFPSPFAVSPISIPRNFDNSNSIRLGGEYAFVVDGYKLDARVGLAYETSAVPPAYESPLTVDMNKVTLGLGGSVHLGEHWRFDAVYAHVFASTVVVDPATAAIPKVNPVQGNPTPTAETINGGTYTASADVIGVGLNYRF